MLESLLRLGRTLGVQVVAQGIETPEQLRALGRMGCELGQGPLFSPPLEAAQALKLAEARSPGGYAGGLNLVGRLGVAVLWIDYCPAHHFAFNKEICFPASSDSDAAFRCSMGA